MSPAGEKLRGGQDANNSGNCYPHPSYNAKIPKTFFQGWFTDCDCGDRPPAGCGAVAMGQVMWYWQWPKKSPYRIYNWDLMPYKLTNRSTTAEGDEVANLLRDCGIASHMTYACLGSFTTRIDEALTEKFSYKSVRKTRKSEWTGTAWNDLIRSEISCGRPVIYYGAKANTLDKRHYFVVDGLGSSPIVGLPSSNFHINFGWQGTDNGFFYLGNIFDSDGITYNDNQYALIGISPTYYAPEKENVTDVSYTTVTGNVTVDARQNISLPAPGKSLIVENGASLTLVAGNSITLNPGFEVRPGGKFATKIEPDYTTTGSSMDITITSLPAEIYDNETLKLSANNANSFDFTVRNSSDSSIVYQSAGGYVKHFFIGDYALLWMAIDAKQPGVYTCTVHLRNNYGRELEHTWNVTVKNGSSKSAMVNDTIAIRKASLPESDSSPITDADVTVYPNPASGTVNISIAKSFAAYSLKVYNAAGALVHQDAEITGPAHSFDMSRFADGTYLLQMEIDRQPVLKKIILAR